MSNAVKQASMASDGFVIKSSLEKSDDWIRWMRQECGFTKIPDGTAGSQSIAVHQIRGVEAHRKEREETKRTKQDNE